MHIEFVLTPAGRLRLQQSEDDREAAAYAWMAKVPAIMQNSFSCAIFFTLAAKLLTVSCTKFDFLNTAVMVYFIR
jgi:hypothetical protein